MSDQYEREPVVDAIVHKIDRRVVAARWLFAMIDGSTRMKEISEALVAGGLKPNVNSANNFLHFLVDDVNSIAERHLDQPLIVKSGMRGPYSCSATTAEYFLDVRSTLLPMDIGTVDPSLFMSESEAEAYQLKKDGYDEFVVLASIVEEQLPQEKPKAERNVQVGDSTFVYPNATLAKLVEACLSEGVDIDRVLTKEQKDKIKITSSIAPVINDRTMSMVNTPLFILTPSKTDRGKLEYQICGLTLEKLQIIAHEIAALPLIDTSHESARAYRAGLSAVNDFLNGGSKQLGFVNELSIGSSLLLRNLLQGFNHDDRRVMLRRSQIMIMLNNHLAAWGCYTKRDQAVINFTNKMSKGRNTATRPKGGACEGLDPELFYPERGESTVDAKDVCARCMVRPTCREAAVINGEKHGIWGGLSERERRKLRAELKAKGRAEATKPNDDVEEYDYDEQSSA